MTPPESLAASDENCRANVTICNKLGLHARASAKLAACTSAFDSEIYLEKHGIKVNGKSILGIMMLAASKETEITIHANGHDAATAIATICQLIENRFGEEE
ncbi:MAG: HPr family phosphocarrier protein [Mariprofundales bacterium]